MTSINAALDQALNEMLLNVERHGCSRCWSDDLGRPCTCLAERSIMRGTVHAVINRLRDIVRADGQQVTK